MRRAVLLASLVGTLLAGSVGAASTATVTVTDSALSPATVRVDVGGKVTWTNKGKLPMSSSASRTRSVHSC